MGIDRADFDRYVQDALEHLYDPAYLLAHPLAALLVPRAGSDAPHQLHRTLHEAIGALKPPADAPLHSPGWRMYRYLSLRYLEMLTISQVAADLGISPRQCRRDHHDALRAVSSILWEEYRRAQPLQAGSSSEASGPGDRALEDELGKMAAAPPVGSRVDQIVQSVVGTLATLALRKSVQLRATIPPGLPAVALERTVLRQILLELLLDAIDRGAGGQVLLDGMSDDGQVALEIVVRPPAGLAPSRQGDGSVDDARLVISRRLADLQGATLTVVPREGCFAIKLSLPTAEAPIVLVVDDNADVVRLLRQYLRGLYEVHQATSGKQALKMASQLQPAVITLDVMMPGQDGWEVLQILKHDPSTSRIPVIVCSVLRERELALSLGAADFLAKPVSASELLAAVHQALAIAGRP